MRRAPVRRPTLMVTDVLQQLRVHASAEDLVATVFGVTVCVSAAPEIMAAHKPLEQHTPIVAQILHLSETSERTQAIRRGTERYPHLRIARELLLRPGTIGFVVREVQEDLMETTRKTAANYDADPAIRSEVFRIFEAWARAVNFQSSDVFVGSEQSACPQFAHLLLALATSRIPLDALNYFRVGT